MRNKSITTIIVICISVTLFQYCTKDKANGGSTTSPVLPATAYNYSPSLPAYLLPALAQQDNTPATNPITNDGATLGRVLFYDRNLSRNNSIACASCHKQNLSFSDDAVKSFGFEHGTTRRHSMALLNVRFYKSGKMFWDERAATLEDQVLMPIQDGTEMGMTLPALETKLQGLSYYPELFRKAFGSTDINSERISRALAQFVRSIVTYQSKYDRVKSGQENFTTEEAAGEQLFLTAGAAPCGSCHRPPMFLSSSPAGPFALQDPNDAGINNENRFKSGSLRNIAGMAPIFHNGSVGSVQAMLNGNIPAHGVLPADRQKLIAFLNTLTDNTITTEPRFSDPFK